MKEELVRNEAVRNEAGGTKGMARRLAVLVLAAGLLAGCAGSSGSGTAAGDASGEQGASRQVTILVAAAASLKNAFEQQLIPMFEEQHPVV